MTYESPIFKEHHTVRLPFLQKLLSAGWNRFQIICPSPDSIDKEWQVPKTPSDNASREAKRRFAGYPVDIAIFDEPAHVGEWDHIIAIVETKAETEDTGISQLETYLGLEPHAVFGIWTNGNNIALVYKQADLKFKVVRDAEIPRPDDNYLFAGDKALTYSDLKNHAQVSSKNLNRLFSDLLNHIAANDSKITRADDRLDNICNMLLLKLDSDTNGKMNSDPNTPLQFQLRNTPFQTAQAIKNEFILYKNKYPFLFQESTSNSIKFDDDTIHAIVYRLQGINLKDVEPETLSAAFQVFRTANVKQGEGQYFTPQRIIEAAVRLMDITFTDKVIDPACGTGGFLFETYRRLFEKANDEQKLEIRTWAHRNLYGVDLDSINVKLARSLMIGAKDGSTNIAIGDSLRSSKWKDFRDAEKILGVGSEDSFDVVLTNPPFGEKLKIKATDARFADLSICRHTNGGMESDEFADTELGIAFVERSFRLLHDGGRLGIVLPETYFFSSSYRWFRTWVFERFELLAVMNIPMEAFQGFCRAKTNFYVFRKLGLQQASHPVWRKPGKTWITYAPTIGINKDGNVLYTVNEDGTRTKNIDDKVLSDVVALFSKAESSTSCFVDNNKNFIGVPQYFNEISISGFKNFVKEKLPEFEIVSLGELEDKGLINIRAGHGSPSADTRNGTIPYVKVSDLRAGMVNFNPTNMVPRSVAEKFWRDNESGLQPWSVVTPSRASKNIGEPAILLPGQEEAVFTKEVLIFNVDKQANFDNFYLGWALDLKYVRAQWDRVVFMQTNREDLGMRYREILIPVPIDRTQGMKVSEYYRRFYLENAKIRKDFLQARTSFNS